MLTELGLPFVITLRLVRGYQNFGSTYSMQDVPSILW